MKLSNSVAPASSLALPQRAASTWRAIAAIAIALGCTGLFWSISAPRTLFSDYLKAYYPAGKAVWVGVETLRPLYDATLFVNLPVVAWLVAPLSGFSPSLAMWAFFVLGVVATAVAWRLLLSLSGHSPSWMPVACVCLFLVNGPLIYSLREGNLSHVVLLLLVLSLLLWRAERFVLAGMVLGVCAVIKLPLLLFAPWLVARRHGRAALGMALTLLLAVGFSVLAFGATLTVLWYEQCVSAFAGGVLAAYNVQTLDAFLLRLQTGATHLQNYLPVPRSLAHQVVRGLCLLALFGTSAMALFRRRANAEHHLLEFSLVLTAALVISPLSWSHYYCMLLVPWCLYLGGALRLPADPLTRFLVGGSMVLSSFPVLRSDLPLLFGPVTSRTIASVCFIGGVLLLVALLRGLLVDPVRFAVARTATEDRPNAKM